MQFESESVDVNRQFIESEQGKSRSDQTMHFEPNDYTPYERELIEQYKADIRRLSESGAD